MIRFSSKSLRHSPRRLVCAARFNSTTASSNAQSRYAPGFAPPEGSRETPKAVPPRRNPAHSLPAHLGNAESSTAKPANSVKQQYRQDLRAKRHEYARELLEKYGKRQAAIATKMAENEQQLQKTKNQIAAERKAAKEHEAQVVKMLELDLKKRNIDFAVVDRSAEREANRKAHEEKLSKQRRKHLLKLYNATENFVTLENLDEKIEEALASNLREPFVSNLDEYLNIIGSDQEEIDRRKAAIREVMGLESS
ncbi:hypothetical protein VTP01DRAFT_3353 [Rhizomucor pusillus]|uniref:uncharacterized protein n=1 Tax=Rhizomucor pusillus TaxID=4840 RepID=UPI00374440FC